ncbi:hypothetical protein BDV39DRAFT_209767 [Aspergillus sergii]|uniref:Uncharacterized protein n=1 Tax=Aspergillus sergii TaxID=1034303 RepID=A0A5N6WNL9_9EURO|nr:hypothetical protein BDV39DRAFT_209767 [Aspergillus sergii]
MDVIFFSHRFWRSRFNINEERGYLYRAVRESSRIPGDIDWQRLYHSTSALPRDDRLDETLNMGEPFDGALQHYHGTRWAGTKVETAKIPPKLANVGVSILCENDQYRVITGLDFYSQDGSSESIGYKTPDARTLTDKEMASRIQYRHMSGYSSMSGKRDLHPLQEFYRSPGFHVLMDATSLEGFHIIKTPNGIHELSLIRYGQPLDLGFGYESSECDLQTLQMPELTFVVAMSDVHARRILDLGIRGRLGYDNRPMRDRRW